MLLIYYHNSIVNTCVACGEHWLNMWLTGQEKHPIVKTLLRYSSLTPLERECYEGEDQPYRKRDYKPIIISILLISYNNNIIHTCTSWRPTKSTTRAGGEKRCV